MYTNTKSADFDNIKEIIYKYDCFDSKNWKMSQVQIHDFNFKFFMEAKAIMEKWFIKFSDLMKFFGDKLDLDSQKLDLKMIPNYGEAKK